MPLTFGPAHGSLVGVDCFVKVTVRQISFRSRFFRAIHIAGIFPHEKADDSGFGFIGMYKIRIIRAASCLGAEELAHGPVPIDGPENPGQIVGLLKFLNGGFQNPLLAVVV